MEKYDLAVIGSGPGGYPAAIRAAQLGLSTVLIEREQLGGTCLNWGCIPTKSLIHSASSFWDMKHSDDSGIKASDISFDYSAMVTRKNGVVEKLRGGIAHLLKTNGITLLNGQASFKGRDRLSVGGETVVQAKNIIVATGAVPVIPGTLPTGDKIVDSRAFLNSTWLPKSMIVMGGGIIGCEFACMAAQLGTKVVIVELLPDILAPLDRDVRAEARRRMERELGINIITGKPFEEVKAGRSGVTGRVGRKKLESDLLLVAVGRRPATDKLALDTAGIQTDSKGFIKIDRYCRTKTPSVYAIGDVTGGPQLAHFATAQGLMTVEQIAGLRRESPGLVPSCIFTMPEIGTAGLSEQDAKERNIAVTVGKFPFAASGKAVADGATGGFVKWIADKSTGQLLGAQAVGAHATELIAEAVLAIRFELTASELARTIHSHPTLSEAWMEAAEALHRRRDR